MIRGGTTYCDTKAQSHIMRQLRLFADGEGGLRIDQLRKKDLRHANS